ncbi:hypothetical protein ACOMHN_003751 [Nucella lapillus]
MSRSCFGKSPGEQHGDHRNHRSRGSSPSQDSHVLLDHVAPGKICIRMSVISWTTWAPRQNMHSFVSDQLDHVAPGKICILLSVITGINVHMICQNYTVLCFNINQLCDDIFLFY